MGSHQGVDWRPTIIAFASVNSPVIHHEMGGTVEVFMGNVGYIVGPHDLELLASTAAMFMDALECSRLTAATLAYTLHCSANNRPI